MDTAIAHCEGWSGEFWIHMATLLRDVRTAAAAALDLSLGEEPARRFTAFHRGQGSLQRVREEERVSHAVA